MPKIKYIEHNGKEHDVDVAAGLSVSRVRVSMRHLTEMGDHRVGSGNSSRLPRYAAAADQDTAGR